jgi:amino acid transporter
MNPNKIRLPRTFGREEDVTMSNASDRKLGYWSVVAIGVGGMVGGGIFAVLGLAVQLAHGGTPVAFAIAGLVALLTSYSYAKLSVAYPSPGGTVEFLNQGLGTGLITGSLNVLLSISYVIMLSLYAHAFGSYGASLLPSGWQALGSHLLLSTAVITLTVLNIFGSRTVGEAEEWIVGLKIIILILFVTVGLFSTKFEALQPDHWTGPWDLIAGGMVIFLAYEGFELIATTAQDVRDSDRILPRAYYSSVVFVILLYVMVSVVAVGNLSVGEIVRAKDYALAEAARPFMGAMGFILIGIAAMLSTASAINATLYGAARISYIIARDGELPHFLERKVWHKPIEGLLITAVLTLILANLFNIESISMMGSSGFLLVFAAVNIANVVQYRQTKSAWPVSATGAVACVASLGALVKVSIDKNPATLWVLAGMLAVSVGIEAFYRVLTGRRLSLNLPEQKHRDDN